MVNQTEQNDFLPRFKPKVSTKIYDEDENYSDNLFNMFSGHNLFRFQQLRRVFKLSRDANARRAINLASNYKPF